MATMQDRETFGRARLSFAKEADIDEFVTLLARFESGDIGPDEWRAFRLLRGTYGQRQTGDAQMMRVKIPQGILSARSSTRWPTSPSATREASGTSRRARTCSCTSSSCTTPSPRCASWRPPA